MTETSTNLLGEGRKLPPFELPDEEGRPFDLAGKLEEGPLVLVFYRGDWWPYCNGQLVSYAREYEEFTNRNARIAGISVDPPEHNKQMIEKLGLPFSLLSDARGDLAKLYGLWNADEGVAVPAIIVVDRAGTIRYLYAGQDFADRPGDEAVFEALDEAASGTADGAADGNVEVRLGAEEAREETVRPDRRPMPFEALLPYYRGAYFTTVSLKRRFGEQNNREAFREADGYQQMVKKYQAGIKETAS